MPTLDPAVVPPIAVNDTPKPRQLKTFADARAFTDEALARRRSAPWRELAHRFAAVQSEEDALEAVAALRELLAIEGLLASSQSSAA